MSIFKDILRPLSGVALAAAVTFAAPAAISLAQDAPATADGQEHCDHGHRGRRGHPMRRMGAELNLTDAQHAQIRAIMQEHRASRGERGARGQGRGEIHERIQAVLTPEQRARSAELRRVHAAERIDRRIEHMTERLSLTGQQQQQVRGILNHSAGQRRALMEQGRLDGTSPRQAMQALREGTSAQIRSVLNSEQAAQLDEMRARRSERGARGGRGGRGHRGGGRGMGPGSAR